MGDCTPIRVLEAGTLCASRYPVTPLTSGYASGCWEPVLIHLFSETIGEKGSKEKCKIPKLILLRVSYYLLSNRKDDSNS